MEPDHQGGLERSVFGGGARGGDVLALRSGGLVTANGTAAMNFGREMLIALDLMVAGDAARWYRLFKYGFHEAPQEAAWWIDRMTANQGN